MNIKDKLLQIRKKSGMSQEEFANKIFVSRQTVSNWENGKFYPDIETLIIISDTFKISLDNLLKDDTELIKHIDKKISSHKKLVISLITIIILFIASVFCFYKYHNTHKNNIKLNANLINIKDDSLIYSIDKKRITSDNIDYYLNKEIDIYIDEHDISIKEINPIVSKAKIISINDSVVILEVNSSDYNNIKVKEVKGYNFIFELSK